MWFGIFREAIECAHTVDNRDIEPLAQGSIVIDDSIKPISSLEFDA
ncbi:MAG: hypothetical protein ACR2PA_06475 [Hyphomicrobiaceae bacterium]